MFLIQKSRNPIKKQAAVLWRQLLMVSICLCCPTLLAQDAPLSLFRELPPVLEGYEMFIVEVNMEPGQASQPHRHNAHVYVYVLEGEVEMQVRGGELQKLGPGGVFFESPDDIHQVSRNASATEPAKILVHMVKKAGAPVSVPVTD